MMTARAHLLQFHRRIYNDLEWEVEQNLGRIPRSLKKYSEEYRKEFLRFQSLSSLSELLERIQDCNIAYCGDYHTLRQAQMTNLSLLREMIRKRKVILATELFYTSQQAILDGYMEMQIDETQFLNHVDYNRNFGFDWNNYKPIFDFARANKVRVIAIDSKSSTRELTLHKRDRQAAKIITKATLEQPDSLIWVMIGELHLAPTHLPGLVEKELSEKGQDRKVLIVHQNNERLFWSAARKGIHGRIEIIRTNDNVYCIFNTPPWIKLYSYVTWLENKDNDSSADAGVEEELDRLIYSLSTFLRIAEPELLDFIPSRKLSVARPDLDQKAEMAAKYIHTLCSKYEEGTKNSRDELFRRVFHEALGFLGSKVLNLHREAPDQSKVGHFLAETDKQAIAGYRNKVVKYLGKMLGHRIYLDMLAEKLSLNEVHDLFYESFREPGSAERYYFRSLPMQRRTAVRPLRRNN